MQNMKYLWAIPVLLFLVSTTARADQTWTYQGNSSHVGGAPSAALYPPNPCGCALTGSFTLDNSGNVLSYSFTDGIVTLNQTDSTMQLYDWLGTLGGWSLRITDTSGDELGSLYYGSVGEATDSGTGGLSLEGNRGTWTESAVATPEPGTLALLGAGLVGLFARKTKQGHFGRVTALGLFYESPIGPILDKSGNPIRLTGLTGAVANPSSAPRRSE
jgi:PEP-CTERM motif